MFDDNGDNSPTPAAQPTPNIPAPTQEGGGMNQPSPVNPSEPSPVPQPQEAPVIPSSQPPVVTETAPSMPAWAAPTTVSASSQTQPSPQQLDDSLNAAPQPAQEVQKVMNDEPPIFSEPSEPKEVPVPETQTPPLPQPSPQGETNKDDIDLVSREVVDLYLDHRLKVGLASSQDADSWEQAAQNFPLYATRINDFFQALREAEKVKKESYPEADMLMQKLNFYMIGNEASRMLLTDILWRRTTDSLGKIDRGINFPSEAVAMLKEMGQEEESIRNGINVSPFDVVKSILSGRLRLNRLPQA